MLWHGSKSIFTAAELKNAFEAFTGDASGAQGESTIGGLGVLCAFDHAYKLAHNKAGENGALYGVQELDGQIVEFQSAKYSHLLLTAGEMSPEGAAEFFGLLRQDLLDQGYDRIDIIEPDGSRNNCVLLHADMVKVQSREIMIIPHDNLEERAGLQTGAEMISESTFSELHNVNRLRILKAFDDHISGMGVEDRSESGSRNFSTRVGELNQRRQPYRDHMMKLAKLHVAIGQREWDNISRAMDEAAPSESPSP